MNNNRSILVTVGSTEFDTLISAIDQQYVYDVFHKFGYTQVTYQIGNGKYIPKQYQYFKLKPSLQDDYQQADLIICHCGAGTLLECLRMNKKLIVVNNESLMDNHQMELLNALTEQHYICGINSSKLFVEQIEQKLKDLSQLVPYQCSQDNKIDQIIESLF